jgi:hypothetical protein
VRWAVLLFALLVGIAATLDRSFADVTPKVVTIRISPAFAQAPGAFRPTVVIERHDANRELVLEAVERGAFHVRGSWFEIDGAQRQRVFTPTNKCICWENLPSGQYEAVAILTRMIDGRPKTFTDRRPFRVMGHEDLDPPDLF